MSTFITTALVCRIAVYRDNDCMLTLLSPDHGRISAIARGCRKQGSRLMPATQLFTYGEYCFRKRGDYLSITQCDVRENFFELSKDYHVFVVGQTILQLSSDSIQPGSGHSTRDIFQLLYYSLSYLCYGKSDFRDIFLYFILQLLVIQGVRPATIHCACCGRSTFIQPAFDAQVGALCAHCGENKPKIQPLSLEAMHRMIRLPWRELNKVALPIEVRKELMYFLPLFLQYHSERQYNSVQTFLNMQ